MAYQLLQDRHSMLQLRQEDLTGRCVCGGIAAEIDTEIQDKEATSKGFFLQLTRIIWLYLCAKGIYLAFSP